MEELKQRGHGQGRSGSGRWRQEPNRIQANQNTPNPQKSNQTCPLDIHFFLHTLSSLSSVFTLHFILEDNCVSLPSLVVVVNGAVFLSRSYIIRRSATRGRGTAQACRGSHQYHEIKRNLFLSFFVGCWTWRALVGDILEVELAVSFGFPFLSEFADGSSDPLTL